jgi:D,D-heptose 1,7-bisphosphate phosphatase
MKQAVILAGGQGTRLREISGSSPKPMIPILGKPLLEHIINQCARSGITNIKLLVSFKSEVIKDYFGDGSKHGVSIQYLTENIPRGTAGALMDALPVLDDKFLVIYGDTFFEIDLDHFWQFHLNHNSEVTIFLHPNDHPYDSDLVEVDSFSQVKKIHSYPHDEKWRQNLVNAAIYILNKSSLEDIDLPIEKPDIAKDLFPLMLKKNKKMFGYISTEYIKDMGTPSRLLRVERDIQSGKAMNLSRSIPKIAIFLDRDGTINHEVNHLSNQEEFILIDGVSEAISKINSSGYLTVVVTNQPVIARGELSETDLKEIHNKMETLLGLKGAYIDRLYYCPHHQDSGFQGEIKELKFDCSCRKPQIGLFKLAERDLNILLEKSWVVGDRTSDILAAKNAGMKSVLVQTGFAGKDARYNSEPDYVAKDLGEAINLILDKIEK